MHFAHEGDASTSPTPPLAGATSRAGSGGVFRYRFEEVPGQGCAARQGWYCLKIAAGPKGVDPSTRWMIGRMNLKEGTRRVGIVLGIIGMFGGLSVAWLGGSEIMQQRADFRRFQTLSKLPQVAKFVAMSFGGQRSAQIGLDPEDAQTTGIRTVHYFAGASPTALELSYFEMLGGTIIAAKNPPSVDQYLALPCLPVFGFLLPWGLVKTLYWVAHGFSSTVELKASAGSK